MKVFNFTCQRVKQQIMSISGQFHSFIVMLFLVLQMVILEQCQKY